MKTFIYCLLLIVSLILCGCATVDVSLLEKAKTVPEGSIEITAYTSSNLLAHHFLEEQFNGSDEEGDQSDEQVSSPGLKVDYGLSDNVEIMLSSNLSNPFQNGKIGLKYRFDDGSSNLSYALLSNFYYSRGESQANLIDSEHSVLDEVNYLVTGINLGIIFSYEADNSFALTLSPQISHNRFAYRTGDMTANEPRSVYESFMGGLVLSPSLKFGRAFIVCPELGVFAYPLKDGQMQIQPTLSYSIGLEF